MPKRKVKLRVTDDFAAKIAEIRERDQLPSDSEVIRRALRLYEFLVKGKGKTLMKRAAKRRRKQSTPKRKSKRK